MELLILLIFCEVRQHLLSRYISLEIMRKKKNEIRGNSNLLKGSRDAINHSLSLAVVRLAQLGQCLLCSLSQNPFEVRLTPLD